MFGQISKQIVKAAIANQAASQTARVAAVRGAHSSHSPVESKDQFVIKHVADQDDVLQVGGSWQEYYDERNSRYNRLLAASAILFLGTSIVLQQTVFWNFLPPELPEEMKKDYYPWREFPSQRN